jgi:site-specific DNA recombinase
MRRSSLGFTNELKFVPWPATRIIVEVEINAFFDASYFERGAAEEAGSVRRVPATEIEQLVVGSVRKQLEVASSLDERAIVKDHVSRVEVQSNRLAIKLTGFSVADKPSDETTLYISWQKPPSKRRREIMLPESASADRVRPIRSETRATLVASIARGRRWLNELITDPAATAETIANREGCSTRKVNMTISLAFLAPDVVKGSIEGRLPQGFGVTRLCDLPAEWSRQRQMLELPKS